jgi:hypothetical protein
MATSQFDIPDFYTPFNYGTQKAENANWLSGYTGAIGSQEKIPAITSRLEDQYLVPTLRENTMRYSEAAENAASRLAAVPETVAGTTRESMVTESQKGRMVNAQSAPIQKEVQTYGTLAEQSGRRLSAAQQMAQQGTQLELAQQQKELSPWERSYDMNNVMQAREFSGWTTENQTELTRLIQNQQAGFNWTNAEANRAQELAIQERNYKNQLDLYTKQKEYLLDMWG